MGLFDDIVGLIFFLLILSKEFYLILIERILLL